MRIHHLLLLALLTLSACGFHLRGSQVATSASYSRLYIDSVAASNITAEVKSQLGTADKTITATAGEAEYTLRLENESVQRSVLTVSAVTGKVEEYQISVSVRMSVYDEKGEPLLDNEGIRVIRDYTFDEDAVLGKFTEEEVLKEELTQRAASQIIRRLEAVTKNR